MDPKQLVLIEALVASWNNQERGFARDLLSENILLSCPFVETPDHLLMGCEAVCAAFDARRLKVRPRELIDVFMEDDRIVVVLRSAEMQVSDINAPGLIAWKLRVGADNKVYELVTEYPVRPRHLPSETPNRSSLNSIGSPLILRLMDCLKNVAQPMGFLQTTKSWSPLIARGLKSRTSKYFDQWRRIYDSL